MNYPCGTIHADIIQGTPEWRSIKCGKISASKISDVMAKGKGVTRNNYLAQLVAEMLTGDTEDSYCSAAMQAGIEMEPAARDCYVFVSGNDVEEVGFVEHPHIESAGCSPDGISGDGLVEIKSVIAATHIAYMLSQEVPKKYIKQIQFQLACTGKEWCDFVSYCPRFPTDMQLLIIRVKRDNDLIKEIETEVIMLNREVEATIEKLKSLTL